MTVTLGLTIGLTGAVSIGEPLQSTGAYALARRLVLKGVDGAVDQAVRTAINAGRPHEEYSLANTIGFYSDQIYISVRGNPLPLRVRTMWLDPATGSQNFTTAEGGVIIDRLPFFYIPHNRDFYCRGGGDPANGYEYQIHAEVEHWVRETVVKSAPGEEVYYHPLRWVMPVQIIAADCYDTRPPRPDECAGTSMMYRGGTVRMRPSFKNCDAYQVVVWYDL